MLTTLKQKAKTDLTTTPSNKLGLTLRNGKLVVSKATLYGCEFQLSLASGERKGCYVALRPLTLDGAVLVESFSDAPIDFDGGCKLHCTVIYSQSQADFVTLAQTLQSVVVDAQSSHLELFGADKEVLVLVLQQNAALLKLRDELEYAGILDSSEYDYQPHITLGKVLVRSEVERYMLDKNAMLKTQPLYLRLGNPVVDFCK